MSRGLKVVLAILFLLALAKANAGFAFAGEEARNKLYQSITQVLSVGQVLSTVNSYFLKRGKIETGPGTFEKCDDLKATQAAVVCDTLYRSSVTGGTNPVAATYFFSSGEARYSRGGTLYQSNTQVLDSANPGRVLASFVSYILGRPAIQIFGNVFASGSIAGGRIDFLNQNIASSSGEISSANLFEKIPGYKIDKGASIFWDPAQANKVKVMEDNITELNRRAVNITSDTFTNRAIFLDNFSLTGSYDPSRPEGYVWKKDGDLTLESVNFCGKGTIIVTGKLTIKGKGVDYLTTSDCANSSVGFIVQGTGGVGVENTATMVKGAFFVPNGPFKIDPNGSPTLTIKGSIVSKTFELNKRSTVTDGYGVVIQYDNNVAKNAPPGFRDIIVLSGTEANP